MNEFETTTILVPYRQHCEDRVAVIAEEDRTLIVVADGAGGFGNGAKAAETVLREAFADRREVKNAEQWQAKLQAIDHCIGDGESTGIVVDIRPEYVCGASVGDSQAWIIANGAVIDLTANQIRKPLLGSGSASPIGFSLAALTGILIVATDGFCNYVERQDLPRELSRVTFFEIPHTCVEMVRLPSGDLWDDIGIVVCRQKPRRTPRRRYEI